ncbi:MAG: hypothetical protein SFW35_03890 [Chitinophagales bacterium]|nr:hypothetical protein [Chitinophagales bacterium]
MNTLKFKALSKRIDIHHERQLLQRFRFWLSIFIAGIFISGYLHIPIEHFLLVAKNGVAQHAPLGYFKILYNDFYRQTLLVPDNMPLLAYRQFWMAFTRIAVAFTMIGLYANPTQYRGILKIAALLCLAVVPLAIWHGHAHGVPVFWIGIDICQAGMGLLLLAICQKHINRLQQFYQLQLAQLY